MVLLLDFAKKQLGGYIIFDIAKKQTDIYVYDLIISIVLAFDILLLV